jgi:hypothetical protein
LGNDDFETETEHNDPYIPAGQHGIGHLFSQDGPGFPVLEPNGNVGSTAEWRLHFKEFSRLQIGKKWFRVSEQELWRLHFKFEKINSQQHGPTWIVAPDPPDHDFDNSGW